MELLKFLGGQFSWFVNFLQVLGDVSFFTMLNEDDTGIASQVDLKMATTC